MIQDHGVTVTEVSKTKDFAYLKLTSTTTIVQGMEPADPGKYFARLEPRYDAGQSFTYFKKFFWWREYKAWMLHEPIEPFHITTRILKR